MARSRLIEATLRCALKSLQRRQRLNLTGGGGRSGTHACVGTLKAASLTRLAALHSWAQQAAGNCAQKGHPFAVVAVPSMCAQPNRLIGTGGPQSSRTQRQMQVSARSAERAWPRVAIKTGLKPQSLLSDDYMVEVGAAPPPPAAAQHTPASQAAGNQRTNPLNAGARLPDGTGGAAICGSSRGSRLSALHQQGPRLWRGAAAIRGSAGVVGQVFTAAVRLW